MTVLVGDCVERLRELEAGSIDAVVCDPPYLIGFMGKEFDSQHKTFVERKSVRRAGSFEAEHGNHNPTDSADAARTRRSENQKAQAWHEAWAREALRVLRPGGHLLAFGGTRTFHRLACGIEDAGFEIRDCLMWLQGQGFPKSLNIGCDCERASRSDVSGLRGAVQGVARAAPEGGRAEVLAPMQRGAAGRGVGDAWRQGASGVDGGELRELQGEDDGPSEPGVEGRRDAAASEGQVRPSPLRESADVGSGDGAAGRVRDGASAGDGAAGEAAAGADGGGSPLGSQSAQQSPEQLGALADESGSQAGGGWSLCPRCGKPLAGLGTALKPGWEPIVVARKPLMGTVAGNVLAHGTGAINVDGCRIGMTNVDREATAAHNRHAAWGSGPRDNNVYSEHRGERASEGDWNPAGRWPANVVLSHSEDCVMAGDRQVRANGHHPSSRGASATFGANDGSNAGGLRGHDGLEERRADGERVERWACVPGCPGGWTGSMRSRSSGRMVIRTRGAFSATAPTARRAIRIRRSSRSI